MKHARLKSGTLLRVGSVTPPEMGVWQDVARRYNETHPNEPTPMTRKNAERIHAVALRKLRNALLGATHEN